jgi:hypothetical protein
VKSDGVTENNSLWSVRNQLSRPEVPSIKKRLLTRSDQSDENCDDHEEYRDVFDDLRGLSISHVSVWGRSSTHDGATLLP